MYRKDSGISVSSDSSHTLVVVDSASSVWTTAMKEYLTDSSLTKEEQQICQLRSPDDFISDLGSTTLTELQKSRLHHGMKRVQPFLKILEKFKGALDVFANADPHGVLACVWGSIRLVLVVSRPMRPSDSPVH